MKNTALFVLTDQFADWEFAPLASAVNQFSNWTVQTVSVDKSPVKSIGGLSVAPDRAVGETDLDGCAGLFLIGGNSWRAPAADKIGPLVETAVEKNIVVGAICDATTFLARLGVLNTVAHTGNMPSDLKLFPNYTGEKHYQPLPAVRDGKIVTANGCAPLEFARESIVALGLLNKSDAGRWYNTFKFGLYESTADALWWFERIKTV